MAIGVQTLSSVYYVNRIATESPDEHSYLLAAAAAVK